jgi:hypothetical protein
MRNKTIIIKFLLLAFVAMLTLFNSGKNLIGSTCESDPPWFCERTAEQDCVDFCDLHEGCDYVEFAFGYCYSGVCFQDWELHCNDLYWDEEQIVCMPVWCAMK